MKTSKTPKTDATKAVLYVRVSTEDQNLGPEAQKAAAVRWAEQKGSTIVAVHVDHGVSGAAPLHKCEGLLAALASLKEHGAGVLLVAKRDRLSRDMMKTAMVEAQVLKTGAKVISAAGEGEGDDPAAALMRRMIDAFAEYERALIVARTCAALAVKKSKGQRTGSVPYGFRVLEDGKTLAQDEAEVTAIRYVRSLQDQGLSLRKIGARLDSEGFSFRTVNKWHFAASVQRIINANV
jgi:DNA invertase Pin-like site-specific DNA recombinase